jgi:hypothetical protein
LPFFIKITLFTCKNPLSATQNIAFLLLYILQLEMNSLVLHGKKGSSMKNTRKKIKKSPLLTLVGLLSLLMIHQSFGWTLKITNQLTYKAWIKIRYGGLCRIDEVTVDPLQTIQVDAHGCFVEEVTGVISTIPGDRRGNVVLKTFDYRIPRDQFRTKDFIEYRISGKDFSINIEKDSAGDYWLKSVYTIKK